MTSGQTSSVTGAGAVPRRAVGAGWLTSGILLLVAAQNLILWQFLGLTPLWLYAAGGLLLAFVSFGIFVTSRSELHHAVSLKTILICAVVSAALLILGGEGRFFYANYDWQVRDAVLRDLSVLPWPFVYTDRGVEEILRAPLGMYLAPALVARSFGYSAGAMALLVQNVLLTTAVFATASLLFRTTKARLAALFVFLIFSGMDVLGVLVMWGATDQPVQSDHIEFWSGIQYSSHITQLFWVPQHALAGWIGALLYLLWRAGRLRVTPLLAAVPLLALWSPLSAMGTLPFAAYAGVTELLRKQLGIADLALPFAAVLLSVPALLYLISGGEGVGLRFHQFYAVRYVVFLALEALPFLFAVFVLTRGGQFGLPTLAITTACLILAPLIQIGEGYDFMMRASIPALAILAVMVADALPGAFSTDRSPWRKLVAAGLAAALAIGSVTGLLELRRAILLVPPPVTKCNLVRTANQVVGLEQTSNATYLAPLSTVPAPIRPDNPALVNGRPDVPCWDRPWQIRRPLFQ